MPGLLPSPKRLVLNIKMGACCSSADSVVNQEEIDLSHFELLKVVGRGGFGKVNAVRGRDNVPHNMFTSRGRLYAMKTLKKAWILSMQTRSIIWMERNVMTQFKSNFLVKLHWAFQDDQHLYLVMDFMAGGDLHFHLKQQGRQSEDAARFYAAELLLALEELNELNYIYRDLKPENILLDDEGHLRISDFGLVHRFVPEGEHGGWAGGEFGTHGYLAPEVLTGELYGTSQDVWGFGVTLYELLHRRLPFASTHEVISGPLHFRSDLTHHAAQLLTGLLCKNPVDRFGCHPERRWSEVKQHPWFAGVDWVAVAERRVPPPFVPDTDVANCSSVYELEDQLLGDASQTRPIAATKQRFFQGWEFKTDLRPPPAPGSAEPGAEADGHDPIDSAGISLTPLKPSILVSADIKDDDTRPLGPVGRIGPVADDATANGASHSNPGLSHPEVALTDVSLSL